MTEGATIAEIEKLIAALPADARERVTVWLGARYGKTAAVATVPVPLPVWDVSPMPRDPVAMSQS